MRALLSHPPAARRSYLSVFLLQEPLVPRYLAPVRDPHVFLEDYEPFLLPTALPQVCRDLARLRFWSGVRNLPAMLRHYPVLDLLRRAAADHGSRGGLQALPAGRPVLATA